MAEYKLTATPDAVIRTIDGLYIPNDPANMDWVQYQAWLDAGGVPDPYITPMPSPDWDWGPRFVDVLGRGTTGAKDAS